jgi:hypothetical protein
MSHAESRDARACARGSLSRRRDWNPRAQARALLIAGLIAVCAVAGCAGAVAINQQRSEAEIRYFADETALLYELPKISLVVNEDAPATGALYRRGQLVVSAPTLLSPYRDAVLAHEMARYVLGHDAPLRAQVGYERQREHELREMEANAKAVEILTRVTGISEEQALRTIYAHLLAFHRALQRGADLMPPGHRPPCEEIADLLSRFPQHAAWTGSLDCAPPALAVEARPRGQRIKESREPGREGSKSADLVYAYFTDTPITPALRPGPTSMPRNTSEFYVDEDKHLALFLGIKNSHRKIKVVSRWVSPDGVQRRFLEREIDQSRSSGAWTWLTDGNDISGVWLYPGRWEVKVAVDGEDAGTFHFQLHPGVGQ